MVPRTGRFARAGRRTNLAILVLLVGCALSGGLAFATARGAGAVLAAGLHGTLAVALLVLAPWKSAIVGRVWRSREGARLRRIRPTGWLLVLLVVICLGAGFVQLLVGYVVVGGLSPIQVHVGSAALLAPVLVWHVVSHRRQRLRRTDLTRRRALVTVAGLAGSAVGVVALTGAAQVSRGPARRPAATGSRPVHTAPATIWLFDPVPALADDHPVRLPTGRLTSAELAARATPVTARLDCTSGWYADQVWSAVPLERLLGTERPTDARSVVVRSVTGYTRTFPATDLGRLWLAVAVDDAPLDAAHGGPVRLLAPGRRGFWWVKWVDEVRWETRPSWRQPPFPLQ
ncbi:hypothetical protein FHX74_001430 [Friedmanniella endophytica]|uniref:Oxidoreductase molybdopterin-binding domain-containing protein n=1 Tax=Microlunatus kandeliicorticis TaxID=1759536 RepID=A0A7W3IRG6_9ACTN|nr:molybdopterin-dependent oxidoreductase [Microlunatus kandeliicorticis]MBA8793825.1 hypothetical protein [Microlunatus kandeliicorticis]